jgi:two-component system response regulator AtoC
MEKVLIIDDDPAICSSLSFALSDSFEVLSATDPREALYYLEREDVAVTILDLRLGPVDGLQVLREIRRIDPRSVIIVLTAYGTIRSSVEAMKGGAFYYLTKPVDSKELKTLIERGVEIRNLYKQVEALSNELRKQYEVSGIVGRSKAIHRVLDMVDRVKDIESNVVVLGESGTGKELVARALHFCGYRREQPFQVVNCAAIPEALLESELFGHVKGAFTGASYSYEGKLRAADGGTVFFDEIGEMPLSLQAKVLRFLQDRTVTPIGSLSSFEVNVRVIAATNRDLERLVHEGLFREDLFYRLNVIVIEVPPLRERKEDIPILAKHFIAKHARLLNRDVSDISPEALKSLFNYHYPGNIRELENIIERAVALADGNEVGLCDLPPNIHSVFLNKEDRIPVPSDPDLIPIYMGESLESVERKLILRTLAGVGGKQKDAARILGITDRTLRNKLKTYRDAEKDS